MDTKESPQFVDFTLPLCENPRKRLLFKGIVRLGG